MRHILALAILGSLALAQTLAQITALADSTTIWSPYPADTSIPNLGAVGPLDWGGSYTDTNHTSSGHPLSIFRLSLLTLTALPLHGQAAPTGLTSR